MPKHEHGSNIARGRIGDSLRRTCQPYWALRVRKYLLPPSCMLKRSIEQKWRNCSILTFTETTPLVENATVPVLIDLSAAGSVVLPWAYRIWIQSCHTKCKQLSYMVYRFVVGTCQRDLFCFSLSIVGCHMPFEPCSCWRKQTFRGAWARGEPEGSDGKCQY